MVCFSQSLIFEQFRGDRQRSTLTLRKLRIPIIPRKPSIFYSEALQSRDLHIPSAFSCFIPLFSSGLNCCCGTSDRRAPKETCTLAIKVYPSHRPPPFPIPSDPGTSYEAMVQSREFPNTTARACLAVILECPISRLFETGTSGWFSRFEITMSA